MQGHGCTKEPEIAFLGKPGILVLAKGHLGAGQYAKARADIEIEQTGHITHAQAYFARTANHAYTGLEIAAKSPMQQLATIAQEILTLDSMRHFFAQLSIVDGHRFQLIDDFWRMIGRPFLQEIGSILVLDLCLILAAWIFCQKVIKEVFADSLLLDAVLQDIIVGACQQVLSTLIVAIYIQQLMECADSLLVSLLIIVIARRLIEP